jgi:hypothetical protein
MLSSSSTNLLGEEYENKTRLEEKVPSPSSEVKIGYTQLLAWLAAKFD